MKKFMLSMSAALISLSACSKGANEPVVQTQDQQTELRTITFSIEGEREDITIVDEEGRALDGLKLTGTATGNRLKKVTLGDSESVPGVVYLYNSANPTQSLARRVNFKVKGNKISYTGTLTTAFKRGDLALDRASVYIGGKVSNETIEAGGPSTRGGVVNYAAPTIAVRTEGTVDLSKLNPIYTCEEIPVSVGTGKAGEADFGARGVRFKLYGQFVSAHCRMTLGASATLIYNGFAIRGWGTKGLTLKAPAPNTDPKLNNRPVLATKEASAKSEYGNFIKFDVPWGELDTYYLVGDGTAPTMSATPGRPKQDHAYTFYIFPEAEPTGGLRLAYNGTGPLNNPFQTGSYFDTYNSNYWSDEQTRYDSSIPYTIKNPGSGVFHNILLVIQKPGGNK